jgi:hypothetical protein
MFANNNTKNSQSHKIIHLHGIEQNTILNEEITLSFSFIGLLQGNAKDRAKTKQKITPYYITSSKKGKVS